MIKGLSVLKVNSTKDKEISDGLIRRERTGKDMATQTLRLTFDTDASGTNERN